MILEMAPVELGWEGGGPAQEPEELHPSRRSGEAQQR